MNPRPLMILLGTFLAAVALAYVAVQLSPTVIP